MKTLRDYQCHLRAQNRIVLHDRALTKSPICCAQLPISCIMAASGMQMRPARVAARGRSAFQLHTAHPAARHAAALLGCSRQQARRLKQSALLVPAWPAPAARHSLSARCEASSGAASPPWKKNNARLVLEDGSVWHGVAFGATGQAVGEVVFNTSMSGYQVGRSAQFAPSLCPTCLEMNQRQRGGIHLDSWHDLCVI